MEKKYQDFLQQGNKEAEARNKSVTRGVVHEVHLADDAKESIVGDYYTKEEVGELLEALIFLYYTKEQIDDFRSISQSAGVASGFEITDSGGGEIDVAAGAGLIKTVNSDIGETVHFDFAGTTNLALTDVSVNWIYIDYNGGTPIAGATTDWTTLNLHTTVIIGKVYRDGTDVHITVTRQQIYDVARIVMQRSYEVDGAIRAAGMMLSSSTLYIELTAGGFYEALSRNQITSKDTDPLGAADTFSYYHQNAGTWTKVPARTVIDNLQYNNIAAGLATLTANRYGVHWVYVDHDDHLHVVYGVGNYTLAGAQAAQQPTLPPIISNFAILLGKIIVQKSAAAALSVESAFIEQFIGTTPSDHGALTGLPDNDHPQYPLFAVAAALGTL